MSYVVLFETLDNVGAELEYQAPTVQDAERFIDSMAGELAYADILDESGDVV